MKIAIDARKIYDTGIGRYIRCFLEGLKKINKVELFLLFISSSDRKKVEEEFPEFKIVEVNAKKYSISEQILLPFYLSKSKIKVIFSPHYTIPIFFSGKIIAAIHDLAHLKFKRFLPYYYAKIMIKLAIKRSDVLVVPSFFTKREIINFFNPKREIFVVYPAISEKFIENSKRLVNFEKIKEKYKIPDKYILYVGMQKPHKNIKFIIKAYEILKDKYKIEHSLVIGGKKEKRYFLELKRETSYEVTFTDFIEEEDLPFIYKNAEVFVYPSLYEGFGFPPLEAMICGTPTVVSKNTSLEEVVGDASLYVNPYDPFDIAKKVYLLISNEKLKEKLIRKGYKRVEKFSQENFTKSLLSLIERCV